MLQRKQGEPTEAEKRAQQKKIDDLKLRLDESDQFKKLKIFESMWSASIGMDIKKIPGGYIFAYWDHEKDIPCNPVFVPNKSV